MRKLASIKQISNIRPIDGRDFIVQCNVDGWNVIVKKDEFQEGDRCVYVEIDSKMPETPDYEFLAKKKYIIKTMKMAGVLSEGIAFNMNVLPPGNYKLDQDVTEIMGVQQYNKEVEPDEVEEKLNWITKYLRRFKWYRKWFMRPKVSKSSFPKWIVKTDETRIQNMPHVLDNTVTLWRGTEKLDGSSATFGLRQKQFGGMEYVVCSRNRNVMNDDSNIWTRISDKHKMETALTALYAVSNARQSVVIQGEIIGPSIQGNKYEKSEIEFYVFNVLVDGKSVMYSSAALSRYGLDCVPVVHVGPLTIDDRAATVAEILQVATRKSVINPKILAEGIVFRAFSIDGELVRSFKAVSPDFLIANKE
jgi:hypothetical protein